MTDEESEEDLWETADLLNKTFVNHNKAVTDLGKALMFTSSEAAIAIQTLSQAGISGTEAGEKLRQVMREMLCPQHKDIHYKKMGDEWMKVCEQCERIEECSPLEILAIAHMERTRDKSTQ